MMPLKQGDRYSQLQRATLCKRHRRRRRLPLRRLHHPRQIRIMRHQPLPHRLHPLVEAAIAAVAHRLPLHLAVHRRRYRNLQYPKCTLKS